jgi:Beta-lactamase superfamily domain
MEFIIKNSTITITSDKKEILLSLASVTLDGLDIELPGEYEKGGCLMYAWEKNDEKLYHFRTEGYWIAYIPDLLTDISADGLDFLSTIDILVMPGAKSMQHVMEKIEPRLLITYGDTAHEIATPLGYIDAPLLRYRLKDADLSSDKTGCVVLASN